MISHSLLSGSIVCLEITPVQLTALERQLFDKSRNLVNHMGQIPDLRP